MRRVCLALGLLLAVGAGLGAATVVAPSARGLARDTCTAEQQATATAVLAAFERTAAAAQKAYFKTHRKARDRAAYVQRQQAKRAQLRAAAACTITQPSTTSVTTTTTATAPPLPAGEPCAPALDPGSNTYLSGGGPLRADLGVRALGTVRAIMLFVDFAGAPATETTQADYDALVPPLLRFYSTQSYGRVNLQVTPLLKWLRMSRSPSDYGFSRASSFTFLQQLAYMQEAVDLADPDVDFSQYQLVYVVATRAATTIDYSPAFVAYHTYALNADGSQIFGGATLGTDSFSPLRHVLEHETGHAFGMPDYYDIPGYDPAHYDQQFKYAGGWSAMSWDTGGHEFFAYDKYREGWIDAPQIRCVDAPGSITATITPVETAGGVKMAVAKTGPSTAVVAEVRSLQGADSTLCARGVLVYAIDARTTTGQGPLQVETPHPGTDPIRIIQCEILYDAPLQAGESWEDAGVRVDVLAAYGDGSYTVRLTRK